MSQCDKYSKWFSAYMEGDLASNQCAQIEAHLDSCDDCRARYQSLKALNHRLNHLARPKTGPHFESLLYYRLRQEQRQRRRFGFALFGRTGFAPAYAVAALLLIFIGAQIQKSMIIRQYNQINPFNYALLNSSSENGHLVVAQFDSTQRRIKLINIGNVPGASATQTIYLTDKQLADLQRTLLPELRTATRRGVSDYSSYRTLRNQPQIIRTSHYQF